MQTTLANNRTKFRNKILSDSEKKWNFRCGTFLAAPYVSEHTNVDFLKNSLLSMSC